MRRPLSNTLRHSSTRRLYFLCSPAKASFSSSFLKSQPENGHFGHANVNARNDKPQGLCSLTFHYNKLAPCSTSYFLRNFYVMRSRQVSSFGKSSTGVKSLTICLLDQMIELFCAFKLALGIRCWFTSYFSFDSLLIDIITLLVLQQSFMRPSTLPRHRLQAVKHSFRNIFSVISRFLAR